MREGFTLVPPTVTRPFLHASAAMERVLNIRAAHSHLSILASSAIYLFLLYWFIVMSTPASTKLLIISHAVSMAGARAFISSSL